MSHLAEARSAGTPAGGGHHRAVLRGQHPIGPLPNRVPAEEPAATGLLEQQAWRRQNSEAAEPSGCCVKDAGKRRARRHSPQGMSGESAHPPQASGARGGAGRPAAVLVGGSGVFRRREGP